MRTDLFDFALPEERIALHPVSPRDAARLLVVPAGETPFADRGVRDLPALLREGDALVFNDTRVIPAALEGVRRRGDLSANVAVTLIERLAANRWLALARPAKRLQEGDRLHFGHDGSMCLAGALDATVVARGDNGEVEIGFDLSGPDLDAAIAAVGQMPLPPYIAGRRGVETADRADYQTIYAAHDGAVAAPTAGLHFTPELMAALDQRGIARHFVTLHVGAGTFLPVKADDTAGHKMHFESGEISAETAAALNAVRARRRAHCRRRHHVAAPFGNRRPVGRATTFQRRHRHLHHARLRVPRRRYPDDQLPPAALDAVHAGGGIRRARAYAGGLSPRYSLRLPLLFLRRRLAAVSFRTSFCHPGRASGATAEPGSSVRLAEGHDRLNQRCLRLFIRRIPDSLRMRCGFRDDRSTS